MKEADTQGERQVTICPSIHLTWNLRHFSCLPSLELSGTSPVEWPFCLLLTYTKEGSLDSLVTNTFCLDVGLLGSPGYFCLRGLNDPKDFSLLSLSPFVSYRRDCRFWSFFCLANDLFFVSNLSLLFVFGCFCFFFSPAVGAKSFPQPAKF